MKKPLEPEFNIDLIGYVLQPILRVSPDGQVNFNNFEILAREYVADSDVRDPNRMIDDLEKFGELSRLDYSMLQSAGRFFRHLGENQPNTSKNFNINVNLSCRTLADPDCAAKVSQSIKDKSIDAQQIGIEILEDSFDDDEDIILKNIRDLALAGHPIYIDDFGTGESNMERVNKVKALLDSLGKTLTVKVDRSVTEAMQFDNDFNALFELIDLDVDLVLEGATPEALAFLQIILSGQNDTSIAVQGFKFLRPMTGLEAAQYVLASQQDTPPPLPDASLTRTRNAYTV